MNSKTLFGLLLALSFGLAAGLARSDSAIADPSTAKLRPRPPIAPRRPRQPLLLPKRPQAPNLPARMIKPRAARPLKPLWPLPRRPPRATKTRVPHRPPSPHPPMRRHLLCRWTPRSRSKRPMPISTARQRWSAISSRSAEIGARKARFTCRSPASCASNMPIPRRSTSSPTAAPSRCSTARLATQEFYFIWQTPLKFLLKDKIDLAKDVSASPT